jgi:hypothetical protein
MIAWEVEFMRRLIILTAHSRVVNGGNTSMRALIDGSRLNRVTSARWTAKGLQHYTVHKSDAPKDYWIFNPNIPPKHNNSNLEKKS